MPDIPRWGRACQSCARGTLDDERHLIFECPELRCFREQWSHPFERLQTIAMQAFMCQYDLIGVARFINAFIMRCTCMHMNKMNRSLSLMWLEEM